MSIDGKQITNYSTTFNITPYIIERLKKTTLEDLLSANDTQFNEIEDVLYQLSLDMWIDSAVGIQLDNIGIIVGIAREGREDEAYRIVLKTSVFINVSSGEPESVIEAFKILFNTNNVEYLPEYPGKFRVWTDQELYIIREYTLIDDLGNFILDDLGNQIIVEEREYLPLSLILQIAPSGVGAYIAQNLIDDLDNLFITDTGAELVVTSIIE